MAALAMNRPLIVAIGRAEIAWGRYPPQGEIADWSCSICGTGRNSGSFPGWSDPTWTQSPESRASSPSGRPNCSFASKTASRRFTIAGPCWPARSSACWPMPPFFRAVRVDPGGYGISWSDDIDLSEYELWVRGTPPTQEPVQPERCAR